MRGMSGSVSEPPAFVAGLDDIAVVREAIEECGGHLCIAEDAGPFAEGEVGGDDDRGPLVVPTDEMEEQLAAGLGEGQIAEFVEYDEVEAGQIVGKPSLAARTGLGLEPVHQVDDVEEAIRMANPT